MPTFDTTEKLEKLYLPSTESLPEADRAYVVIDVAPLKTGDVLGFKDGMAELEMATTLLTERIKEWNYTTENGDSIPITSETVKLLHLDDFTFLQSKVMQSATNLSDTEKKTSLSTSSPSGKIEVQTQ